MPLLPPDEIEKRLAPLSGWRVERGAIVKTFAFGGFPDAVAFVSRLVPGAEAADHHPDIAIHYKRVTLSYSTHSEGGVTEKDFVGAAMADEQSARIH
jgi:4a-hydroxytetrahydrobiopterin dehydratase